MRFFFFISLLVASSNSLFCQDSLCYSDIDKIVAEIKDLSCSKLDTGFVSKNSKERYRECYITDPSGTNLLAVMTSVRDTNFYSTHVNYYFNKGALIKVELADVAAYKKMGLIYFYYVQGSCQPFILDRHHEVLKVYYLRQADKIQKGWNKF